MKQGSMTHFCGGRSNKQQWFMVNLPIFRANFGNKTQAADVYWRLGLYWLGSFPGKNHRGKNSILLRFVGVSGYVEGGLTGLPAGRQESVNVAAFWGCKFWESGTFQPEFLGANALSGWNFPLSEGSWKKRNLLCDIPLRIQTPP